MFPDCCDDGEATKVEQRIRNNINLKLEKVEKIGALGTVAFK